jgi:hypothetical protein
MTFHPSAAVVGLGISAETRDGRPPPWPERNPLLPKLARSFLLVAVAMGFLSCAQDVRPYDVRVKEALSEGLQEFNVKQIASTMALPYLTWRETVRTSY